MDDARDSNIGRLSEVSAGGCGKHDYKTFSSIIFLKNGARGLPHEMPWLLLQDLSEYTAGSLHPRVRSETWTAAVQETMKSLASEIEKTVILPVKSRTTRQ